VTDLMSPAPMNATPSGRAGAALDESIRLALANLRAAAILQNFPQTAQRLVMWMGQWPVQFYQVDLPGGPAFTVVFYYIVFFHHKALTRGDADLWLAREGSESIQGL
jgi:hypothetical protein